VTAVASAVARAVVRVRAFTVAVLFVVTAMAHNFHFA
jgi:hypothetical protein